MKDVKEMLLFFKSTSQKEEEVWYQFARDFENKNYEVDLNNSNCSEDFEQKIRLSTLILMMAKSIMY